MDRLTDPGIWIAFFMLTALEIVLGVDNIVFLSILVGRLPENMRDRYAAMAFSIYRGGSDEHPRPAQAPRLAGGGLTPVPRESAPKGGLAQCVSDN